ncbi:uncharacterized protein AMSG_09417 [Thecamonas trahens ATCC 50062]|uniref:PARP catalytic domain-containing protein n=1 Tax=Thecamonas trahens ATCC 50062 TaxID=461836 RepID=A0A0L0DNY2_THETB|nr:hypothetical protein AMSG_09417 [Thecamonas trahens ATCC 50062]KNC53113.1 hypothetical protein AMSG_09417 [Thecamonas trahens ATCC 50062]|eukprot:XP_013754780.1 hypothetical protein AMSG_09417 [Thecamonas trahens ATCC 50062]
MPRGQVLNLGTFLAAAPPSGVDDELALVLALSASEAAEAGLDVPDNLVACEAETVEGVAEAAECVGEESEGEDGSDEVHDYGDGKYAEWEALERWNGRRRRGKLARGYSGRIAPRLLGGVSLGNEGIGSQILNTEGSTSDQDLQWADSKEEAAEGRIELRKALREMAAAAAHANSRDSLESVIVEEAKHKDDPVSDSAIRMLRKAVLHRVMTSSAKVVHVKETPISRAAFRKFILNLKTTNTVRFAWHGTNPNNLQSIYDKGLCMGGTRGVRVAHGRAHGKGVYMGSRAEISMAYAPRYQRDGRLTCMLLACAVVPSNLSFLAHNGFLISREHDHVLPVYEVELMCNSTASPFPTVYETSVRYKPRHAGTPYYPALAMHTKVRAIKIRKKDEALARERRSERAVAATLNAKLPSPTAFLRSPVRGAVMSAVSPAGDYGRGPAFGLVAPPPTAPPPSSTDVVTIVESDHVSVEYVGFGMAE